jgi:uncharacterized damage-inducible protein DinB
MNEPASTISTIYTGWHTYQTRLTTALTPLSSEQLALRAAPYLRSIGEIVTHMIGARARWFMMEEDDAALAVFATWDRAGMPTRPAAELIDGLAITWQVMQAAIAGWTPTDWQWTCPGEEPDEPALITRSWVIWHLIEHDLHHGGEIALTLGLHGLAAPDL